MRLCATLFAAFLCSASVTTTTGQEKCAEPSQKAQSKDSPTSTQIDPRRQIAVSLGASGPTAKQDNHWGECPAFTHYHPDRNDLGAGFSGPLSGLDEINRRDGRVWAILLDGLCHDDKTDEPVKARPKLPKPQSVPNKKAIWV